MGLSIAYTPRIPVFSGTNADRVAMASMLAGDIYTETDTANVYSYDGASWVQLNVSPTQTYELLGTETLSGAATTISKAITTTPATYRYLKIILYISGLSSNSNFTRLQFNGDTGANYVRQWADDWTNSTQVNDTGFMIRTNSGTAGNGQIIEITLANNSGAVKQLIGLGSSWSQEFMITGGYWNNTNDITSILFTNGGTNTFSAGTTMSVYGIRNA